MYTEEQKMTAAQTYLKVSSIFTTMRQVIPLTPEARVLMKSAMECMSEVVDREHANMQNILDGQPGVTGDT